MEEELEEREWKPDLAERGTGASLGTVRVGGMHEGGLGAAFWVQEGE
jgi:glutamate formiminotransferase